VWHSSLTLLFVYYLTALSVAVAEQEKQFIIMKKSIFILTALFAAMFVNAQTYTIVSRSNDTIKLQSNKVGDAIKSIIPGKTSDSDNNFRLIEKEENGKKSLLFIEFTQILEKIFISYETDMVHAGDWDVKTYGFSDIYSAVKRENAILLKGNLLGMEIEIYQRPEIFKDIINIDGIEFPSPIKVQAFENKTAQDMLDKKQEKFAEMYKLGLTEDDISSTESEANECYIAYLLLTGNFDTSADRTLMTDLCNKDRVKELIAKYNEKQLEYLAQWHDSRLNKYAK
jgi:hypothetical protein